MRRLGQRKGVSTFEYALACALFGGLGQACGGLVGGTVTIGTSTAPNLANVSVTTHPTFSDTPIHEIVKQAAACSGIRVTTGTTKKAACVWYQFAYDDSTTSGFTTKWHVLQGTEAYKIYATDPISVFNPNSPTRSNAIAIGIVRSQGSVVSTDTSVPVVRGVTVRVHDVDLRANTLTKNSYSGTTHRAAMVDGNLESLVTLITSDGRLITRLSPVVLGKFGARRVVVPVNERSVVVEAMVFVPSPSLHSPRSPRT